MSYGEGMTRVMGDWSAVWLAVQLIGHAVTLAVSLILLWALTMDAWDARRRR